MAISNFQCGTSVTDPLKNTEMDAIASMALKPSKTPRSRHASRGSIGSRGLTSGEEDFYSDDENAPRDKGITELVEKTQEELDSAVRHAIDSLNLEKAVEAESSGATPRVEEILEALDILQRSGNAAIESFADGSDVIHKKKMRAQENLGKLKMETMRTATKMKLKQQEVKLVSEHKRDLSVKARAPSLPESKARSGASGLLAVCIANECR